MRKDNDFLRFFFESINCLRCEKNKNECVSIDFHFFKSFQKLFSLLIEKMSWHDRKTIAIFIREKIRLRNFETSCFNNDVSFFFVICIKIWIKRFALWKIYMIQLKRAYKKICVVRLTQQELQMIEKIRNAF